MLSTSQACLWHYQLKTPLNKITFFHPQTVSLFTYCWLLKIRTQSPINFPIIQKMYSEELDLPAANDQKQNDNPQALYNKLHSYDYKTCRHFHTPILFLLY
jgi:hypothetical protein